MKKLVFVMAFIIATGTLFTSCKSDHKEEHDVIKEIVKENDAEVKEEMNNKLIAGLYQCPMDCEDGKTYEEPGMCPVCKMDLKLKEPEDAHEGHDHD
jgi:hypothetical protein